MNAKRANDYSTLPKDERRQVFFARWANADTWNGGCAALVAAEKQADRDAIEAVSLTYSQSSGKPAECFDAWECGECGAVHFGREAAELCCQVEEYEEDPGIEQTPPDWLNEFDTREAAHRAWLDSKAEDPERFDGMS